MQRDRVPDTDHISRYCGGAAWMAGGIAVGITAGFVGGIAGGLFGTRAFYLVGHPFFVWPRLRGHWYRRHPVAWDDLCGIPFPGLCRLLADYARFDRPAAEAEIDRLIDTYPSQRHQALKARILLIGAMPCPSWSMPSGRPGS